MARNARFQEGREPLASRSSLQLIGDKTTGPLAFLNPTSADFAHTSLSPDEESSGTTPKTPQESLPVTFSWSSRGNRKGRHVLKIQQPAGQEKPNIAVPLASRSPRIIFRNIVRMFTQYPVWDVSWLVAYIFTWGSIVWVINGFFVWLPAESPSTEFENEILYGGGITAFIGATIFEFGSILLVLEALNTNRSGCFGWAIEQAFHEGLSGNGHHQPNSKDDVALTVRPDKSRCGHHHSNKKNIVGKGRDASQNSASSSTNDKDGRSWIWWPSWEDLTTHYLHELGFLASFIQLIAATIFWISGFTALPGIFDHLSSGLEDGVFWTPQVIGGTGFIISGFLFMIEAQKHIWQPAFDKLGWHIGFWNLIGGIGFTLSPAFGYDHDSWAQYQAVLSTFWGGWAFLIGSGIQLYESLDKHPVEVKT